MGFCNRRQFLLTICSLQLIITVERQVFDFLGYMWLPILANFFNIIFDILGFFGAYQYRPKYIISYCGWNILWLGWNIFLTCFYLNVGALNKDSDILNFGTGSFSWWLANGPGCLAIYNLTEPELRPARPANVTNCLLDYEIIEVSHASTQCIFAVIAVIGGICLTRQFLEDDDSLQIRKRRKHPRPLYSIEYSQPEPPIQDDSVSPKPMTPRRVKRRSVISRDGTRRSSRRSSVRQSRRKNPVNRIMDHQESLYANTGPSILSNQNVNSLSQSTLNYDRIAGAWDRNSMRASKYSRTASWKAETAEIAASSPNLWNQDPKYANVASFMNPSPSQNIETSNWEGASSTRNLTDNWQGNDLKSQWQGQTNPSFHQTSTQSLNAEEEDIYGNNRPASARSSYSNYHGVRATPQVPKRTDLVRQSQRQFVMSGGPPAYQDTVI